MINNEIIEKTKEFNIQDYLKTPKDVKDYIEIVAEENDEEYFIKAIGEALKSEGYKKIAKKTGLTREGLYKSFSGKSNPKVGTLFKVLNAIGLKIKLEPVV